jgi:ribonuclease HII
MPLGRYFIPLTSPTIICVSGLQVIILPAVRFYVSEIKPDFMSSTIELQRLSITELRARYYDRQEPLPRGLLEFLETDLRRGARELAAKIRARQRQNRSEGQRLRHLLRYEMELWGRGFDHIAGVDEAGIGPLAGPVVAGAVVLPRDYKLRELDDSKKLDESLREQLAGQIKIDAISWAVGIAAVEEIDRLNVYHAGLLAMRRAVENLTVSPCFLLVDARAIPECATPQRGIIRGDQLSATIAAASIIAKTTRDSLMIEIDRKFPGYGFASHKGYSTPEHFEALSQLGASPVHRRSFRPVRQALGLEPVQESLFNLNVNSTASCQ